MYGLAWRWNWLTGSRYAWILHTLPRWWNGSWNLRWWGGIHVLCNLCCMCRRFGYTLLRFCLHHLVDQCRRRCLHGFLSLRSGECCNASSSIVDH